MENLFDFFKRNSGYKEFPIYVEKVCDRIQEKFLLNININKILMVSMPPRSLKTTIVLKYFPQWILKNFHNNTIGLSSYSGNLTRININNTKCKKRDTLIPVNIGSFNLTKFNTFIMDDYFKNEEEANNVEYSHKLFQWFLNIITLCLYENSFTLIVSSRWNENDLIGKILNKVRNSDINSLIDYINIPAILPNGESFWPDRYSKNMLYEIEKMIGDKYWAALYQGNFVK